MLPFNNPHRRRVSSDRTFESPPIQSSSPFSKPHKTRNFSSRYSHLTNNKKKKYIQEVRFTEIERENRLLLEKIHNIIKKPKDISHRKHFHLRIANQSSKRNFCYRNEERLGQLGNSSDDSLDSKVNQRSLELVKRGPTMVFDGKKRLGPKIFDVKILEYEGNVKILLSDKSEAYRLLVKESDIFPEFAWKGDWLEVVNSISVENERLMLCIRPYEH